MTEEDKLFQEIIQNFLNDSPDHRKILSDGLLISLPTVDRWKEGRNLPHGMLRPNILNFINSHRCSCR